MEDVSGQRLADRLAAALLPNWLRIAATAVGLYLPAFLIFGFVYDWDFIVGTGSGDVATDLDAGADPMFLSVLLVAIVIVWLGLSALRAAPTALLRLTDRGAIVLDESRLEDDSDQSPHEVEASSAEHDDDRLPMRLAIDWVDRPRYATLTRVTLAAGALAIYAAMWWEARQRTGSVNPVWVGTFADEFDWPSALAIVLWVPVGGIVLALLTRLFVMIHITNRVAYDRGLNVLVGHPDGAAGLKPLGDQLLRGLIIGAAPATWASIWAIVFAADDLSADMAAQSDRWLPILRFVFVPLFALLMYAIAIRPILHVRSRILSANRELYASVDRLSRTIHQEASAAVARIDVEGLATGQDRVESLQKLYEALFPLPTWPFDRSGVAKFAAALAPSVLSVTGLGDALVKIISDALGAVA